MDGTEDSTATGWRGSREAWLDAAYAALVEEGIDAVKVQALARRLKLSRSSFYWFFETREALLAALADRWEARSTTPLIAATRAYAATETEAMLNVIGCFLRPETFDARLEHAVRGWALGDATMRARLAAADAARLGALRVMLTGWGHAPAEADVRARTVYLVQIGYIAMQADEALATRLMRIPHYVEIYTGRAPSAAEVARFRARFEGDLS
ncbi:TetR/AcrR family transcriptional regulator [Phaeovulum vinaykumarii]|uniref:Transcriptional regulator, TetR family n=1 Tax=Phaeovulum vinaykumarii TaxID=407234 RepID=A0A1N7LLK3_9RHOB|nr:TetR/AcrR family transcriptional regulator [Phaeovulum vinaykumarii]SIS74674.1 transcriptional regulator, TetR family [Phaeovulum vinaykumarii]SOC05190.1 TetR family transcriptional regulator [Phaeovulum vinaykumarii]